MNSKNNSNSMNPTKSNFLYDFVKITGAPPMFIYMRPKILKINKHQSYKGGFMVSANHFSFLDPILIHFAIWKRRLYSLATKDIYDTKLKQFFFKRMHCIQVDKENFSLDSFHEVVRQLKKGNVVSIFPEGQVNFTSNDILTFKTGVALMAHTANVPILPVYLAPQKKWYHRRVAVVGEFINTREICGARPTTESFNKVCEVLREKENELKDFYAKHCEKSSNIKKPTKQNN